MQESKNAFKLFFINNHYSGHIITLSDKVAIRCMPEGSHTFHLTTGNDEQHYINYGWLEWNF